MSRHWKECYSLERASEADIHDYENVPVLGVPFSELVRNPDFRAWPKWIYYVEVRRFTFTFFSLDMIREYLEFYSTKILPSSRFGAAPGVGEGQTKFERLPLRLRKEGKRQKVIKALERALAEFSREQGITTG